MTAMSVQSDLRVAVVQLTAQENVEENIKKAQRLVRRAAEHQADLIVLPENFPYVGVMGNELRIAESLAKPGPILTAMTSLAKELGRHLLLGGVPTVTSDPQRCANSSILLAPDGSVQAVYNKIHLFDINIPNGAVHQESNYVRPGDEVVTTKVRDITVGMSICYDLRFPELYRQLTQRGAEVITVPAAFTLHTGKDHWLPLLRARAIENQVYIVAAGQIGKHTETRFTYGKSCVIDPWGSVIALASDTEGVTVADIDRTYLKTVRTQLPCLTHRRLG